MSLKPSNDDDELADVEAARAAWNRAAAPERATLLARLLQPLGPLARMAVASGAFAAYVGREHWTSVQVPLEDANRLPFDSVLALAQFAHEVQPEVFAPSPALGLVLAAFAAAVAAGFSRRRNIPGTPARTDSTARLS